MRYTFLVAISKGNKNLIKILDKTAGKEVWYETSKDLVEYAKSSLRKDTEYEFQTDKVNGKLTITNIGGAAAASQPVASTAPATNLPPQSTGPTCEDCGKALKDAKYKKCFTCNKKNPAPKPSTPVYTGGQPDARGQSIERQAMMKAAADAVATAMQGQIGDVDALGEMIVRLYEKLLAKITS